MANICQNCPNLIEDKKLGRYCRECFNHRRTHGLRKSTPGTEPAFVNENNEKLCKVCEEWKDKELFRKWRNQCRDCELKLSREQKAANAECLNAKRRATRSEKDKAYKEARPDAKIIANYRTRIWQIVKREKTRSSSQLIGCDRETFMKWLEYNFTDGINFQNYGRLWHMDHIVPCVAFDTTQEEQLYQCFHWSNLVPLEGAANLCKNGKVCTSIIRHYRDRARKFIELTQNKDKGLKLLELTVPNLDSDIRAA